MKKLFYYLLAIVLVLWMILGIPVSSAANIVTSSGVWYRSGTTMKLNPSTLDVEVDDLTINGACIGCVAAGALDLNGQKLTIDADGDTSLTADIDDQIDIEISGADDFQFTANLFQALAGSSMEADSFDAIAANALTIGGTNATSIDFGTLRSIAPATGREGAGNTTNTAFTLFGVGFNSVNQTNSNSGTDFDYAAFRFSNLAAVGSGFGGGRARGTAAAPTVVQDGDVLTQYPAFAFDGTDYGQAGTLVWKIEGAPGDGDTPGELSIEITPDGADVPEQDFTFVSNLFNILSGSNVLYADNALEQFGNGLDYWLNYDSANAQFELNSTNVDGGGADGVVLSIDDGDDVVDFTDGATFGGSVSVGNGNGLYVGAADGVTLQNKHTFQVLGTAPVDAGAIVGLWSADAEDARLDFVKGRGAAIGDVNIVNDNDRVGALRFYPADGVDLATLAAGYHAEVDDATPAAGDIGMAHVWNSMSGGAGALREVMRLSAAGDLSLPVGDLLLPSAGVINFNAGDVTLTHVAGGLKVSDDDILYFGSDADWGIQYDELTNDTLYLTKGSTPWLSIQDNGPFAFTAAPDSNASDVWFEAQKGGISTAGQGYTGAAMRFVSGDGSNAFLTGDSFGGDAGDIILDTGDGGDGDTSGASGAGGDLSIQLGSAGDAGTTSFFGGSGGGFSVSGGTGGGAAAAFANAGQGGSVSLTAGSGGAGSGANDVTGGFGGSLTLNSGGGGAGVNGGDGADGGSISLSASSGGSGGATGTAGDGGAVSIMAGFAGFAGDTPGTGGYISLTTGTSSVISETAGTSGYMTMTTGFGANGFIGNGNGGDSGYGELTTGSGGSASGSGLGGDSGYILIDTGDGGSSATGTAGGSGILTLSTGDGNDPFTSGTAGAGGNVSITGGTGGDSTNAGGAANTGGAGAAIAITAGSGGTAANGTANTGGVAGNITITAGSGAVSTNGGNITLATGGTGTTGGNGGDVILTLAASSGGGTQGIIRMSGANDDVRWKMQGTGVFRIEDSGSTDVLTLDHDGSNALYSTNAGIHSFAQGVTISSGNFIVDNGDARFDGRIQHTLQSETGADTGDGTPRAITLTPATNYIEITCNDADTCDVTMDETGALQGNRITIINISANVVDMADSAGVSELAGVFAMGQYDSVELMYTSDRWVEVARSDN